MQNIKKYIEQSIKGKKAVFLFTGDKDSTLLINVLKDINVEIVFVDTWLHRDEIMDYINHFTNKMKIIKNSDVSIDYTVDAGKCCKQRKAEVLSEYLKSVRAEALIVPFTDEEKIYGIEASYLNGIENIEIIRPLADFTECDIWMKIKEYKFPFSTIYNKGYKVVDCKCCITRFGKRTQSEGREDRGFDKETEEKLKSLGYL